MIRAFFKFERSVSLLFQFPFPCLLPQSFPFSAGSFRRFVPCSFPFLFLLPFSYLSLSLSSLFPSFPQFDFNCLPGNEMKTFVHGAGLYKNYSLQRIYPGTRVVRSIRQISDFKKALLKIQLQRKQAKKVDLRRIVALYVVLPSYPGTGVLGKLNFSLH